MKESPLPSAFVLRTKRLTSVLYFNPREFASHCRLHGVNIQMIFHFREEKFCRSRKKLEDYCSSVTSLNLLTFELETFL